MAGSRSTPPLFDLIRPGADREGEAKAPPPPPPSTPRPAPSPTVKPSAPKPIVRLDTAPRPAAPAPRSEAAPVAKLPPPSRPEPRAAEASPRPGSRQSVTVSVVWLWLAVAGVLASWLVVWGVAYSMGGKSVEERLARYAPTDPPPAASPQPNVPPKTSGTPEKPAAKPAPQNPPQGAPKQASPAPAAQGLPAADTRQAGFNYLLCASGLDKAAAEAAAGFLTQNGVPATAAPTGKSGSKYAVYTLLGIPSGSLDEQLKVRNDHKAEVVRLGKLWKKDNPRASDYSDAYWEKFKQ